MSWRPEPPSGTCEDGLEPVPVAHRLRLPQEELACVVLELKLTWAESQKSRSKNQQEEGQLQDRLLPQTKERSQEKSDNTRESVPSMRPAPAPAGRVVAVSRRRGRCFPFI